MSRIVLALSGLIAALAIFAATPNGCEAQTLRDQSGSYWFEVLINGRPVETFSHRGETYVMGHEGARYTLRIHNNTPRRIEAVASVDGLDVIDGKAASYQKRGYLVPAYGSVDVDGWRLSQANVAAFRFSSVGDSYAGRTADARNVGVIGVAVFREKISRPPRVVYDTPARPRYGSDDLRGLDDFRSVDKRDSLSGVEYETAPAAAPSAKANLGDRSAAGARASSQARMPDPQDRPGLGTEFGETRNSWVDHVAFERANFSRPDRLLGARYNDRQGLIAMGVIQPRRLNETELRRSAQPFSQYAVPPRNWQWDY